jgi:RecB family endonuclease NucS
MDELLTHEWSVRTHDHGTDSYQPRKYGQSVNTTAIKTIEDSYMVEYAELKNKETVAINNKGFFFISSYDSRTSGR